MSKIAGITFDDDHLSAAVAHIQKIQVLGNAHGGCITRGGIVSDHTSVCHGFMRRLDKPSIVYSKWTADKRKKANRLYFDWITGPDSPWKEAFPPEELEIDKINISSKDFMWEHGFIFWHISVLPSNVQHQFLIATRVAKQHTYYIDLWSKLVEEHGFDPNMAYVWMTMWYGYEPAAMSQGVGAPVGYDFLQDKCKIVRLHRVNSSEFNFDSATSGVEAVKNFLTGRMDDKVKNAPYKNNVNYSPVNRLWGPNDCNPHGAGMGYPAVLERMYSQKIGKSFVQEANGFQAKQTIWSMTPKECVEVGLMEQERLFKECGIEHVRQIAA